MHRYFIYIYMLCSIGGNSLQVPPRKFIPNRLSPSSDIYSISGSEASTVSKYWLHLILQKTSVIAKEDEHIVKQINHLESYIQEHLSKKNIYMAWMPKGSSKEVLFLVVASVDTSQKTMNIHLLVQSPTWSMEQIESIEMKKALVDMAINTCTELSLTELYKNEPRYSLDWNNWYK